MARTTKEEALRTRQRIINTAIRLFYTQGVSATTLENIAETAGLTRGAIYWHFKNKLDVITAIHDQIHLSIMEAMFLDLKNTALSPLERMHSASKRFMASLIAEPEIKMVLSIFFFKCDYSGDMAAFLARQAANKNEALRSFAACFQEGLDDGSVTPAPSATFLAQNHMYFLTGLLSEYLRSDKPDSDLSSHIDFYFARLARTGKQFTITNKPVSFDAGTAQPGHFWGK